MKDEMIFPPRGTRVLLFEKENEFAECLKTVLIEAGVTVSVFATYDDLLRSLGSGTREFVICDLIHGERAEAFLRKLARVKDPPRAVFTSIYNDPLTWAGLRQYPGPYLFMPKPFRVQTLVGFLFPRSLDRAARV